MNSDSYWYKSYRIGRTSYDASRWGVSFEGQLLCDSYGSAEEAALAANKKDFDNEDAVRICGGSYAPSDLSMWRTSPQEILPAPSKRPARTACKSMTRETKASSSRL
jgi:hypothetical protein